MIRGAALLGVAAAAAISIAAAPVALAASAQPCFETGGATDCQAPGNVQIYTAPHPSPAVVPHSDPRWRALGYNPKWDGFEP